MNKKWICKKCGNELYIKPHKNAVCECGGRFQEYRQCKCGTWFHNYHSIFCSPECRGYEREENKKPIILRCEYCGTEFKRYASAVNEHNYCSRECRQAARKGEVEHRKCLHCGKDITVYVSTLEKSNASGNYCSRECYWEAMRQDIPGKNRYYGFREAKKKSFRGKQFCAICGRTDGIAIHHIIPNRLTHDNSAENLIPLCRAHHATIESHTRKILEYDSNYEQVFIILSSILRQRQFDTWIFLKGLKDAL